MIAKRLCHYVTIVVTFETSQNILFPRFIMRRLPTRRCEAPWVQSSRPWLRWAPSTPSWSATPPLDLNLDVDAVADVANVAGHPLHLPGQQPPPLLHHTLMMAPGWPLDGVLADSGFQPDCFSLAARTRHCCCS